MTTPFRTILIVVAVVMTATCSRSVPLDPELALKSITDQDLARDVSVLASDEYEGRKPGTRGEDLTVAFLERRFRELGLAPGNPDGSYVQRVPLIAVTSAPTAFLTIHGRRMRLRSPQDFIARSMFRQDRVTVPESEVVFAGYGIDAPEYGWNDYNGVDVKGKILLLLLGEPSRPAPADPTGSDPAFFRGIEQSYYATTRSKRDTGAAKGATAEVFALGPSIDYEGVAANFRAEALDIDEQKRARLPVQAAMPAGRLADLLAMEEYNLDSLIKRAQEPDFRAFPLKMTMSFDVTLRPRALESRNVIAKLEGADPRMRDEYVVFSAHWDAFGRDPTRTGDQIRNGAIDNALGVAQLLGLAEAFKKLPRAPRRSILFLVTTAEESGLLGAKYYVENPLYPLARTVASINLDNSFPYGRTSDVINFGDGRSELDDLLREVAGTQSRTVVPDPFPTEGFYFRLDHFEFANVGIPAISPAAGIDVIGKPPGYGKAKVDEYLQRDYHEVGDEVRPDWDYGGAVQDTQMDFLIGLRVAEMEGRPAWKAGAEFKRR